MSEDTSLSRGGNGVNEEGVYRLPKTFFLINKYVHWITVLYNKHLKRQKKWKMIRRYIYGIPYNKIRKILFQFDQKVENMLKKTMFYIKRWDGTVQKRCLRASLWKEFLEQASTEAFKPITTQPLICILSFSWWLYICLTDFFYLLTVFCDSSKTLT